MKIHEYQAKQLFSSHGIPIPRGSLALNPAEAVKAAAEIAGPVVLKAQVHAGGRGKGGGVQRANTGEEVELLAAKLLGMKLITPQTGPKGKIVNKLLVEEALAIEKELYLGILIDRATAKIIVMASTAGGMDIEETAATTPEKIARVSIDPLLGIQGYHCRRLAFSLGLGAEACQQFMPMLAALYRLFVEYDCSLLEINPLILTAAQKLMVLDAKLEVDNNALFRQPLIRSFRDLDEEEPLEVEAREYHLNYIKLDGTIGNLVNGAGLAMATMDLIKKAGAEPANFLDVGGGATAEMVENGFRIILSDPKVKAVLVNIFGGILRCDILARGIVEAAGKCRIGVPVIVRLEGTNAEAGRQILLQSGFSFIPAADLQDAGEKVAMIGRER